MADAALEGAQAYGVTQQNINTGLLNQRRTLAYNALRQVYGDAAGDPEAWKADVAAKTEEAKLPYAGQQAEATVANTNAQAADASSNAAYRNALVPGAAASQGAQTDEAIARTAFQKQTTAATANELQRQGAFRALSLLQNSVNPETGSVDADTFDRIVGANADTLGIDAAHMDPLKTMLTAPGGAAHLDTIKQGLIGPTQVTGQPIVAQDDKGNSLLVNRDKYGNTSTQALAPGTTPVSQQNADTKKAVLNERTRQDNYLQAHGWTTAQISAFRASTGAENTEFGSGGATLPSIQGRTAPAPAANPPPAPAPAAAPPGNPAAAPPTVAPAAPPAVRPAWIDTLPPKGQQSVAADAKTAIGVIDGVAQAKPIIQQLLRQITSSNVGPATLLKSLRGSVQANVAYNLDTLKGQEFLTIVGGQKNSKGQTGLGRILQAEVGMLNSAYGNMAQDQTVGQLTGHLNLLNQIMDRTAQKSQAGFSAAWRGADPYSVLGVKPYSPDINKSPAVPTPDEAKAELARRRGGK